MKDQSFLNNLADFTDVRHSSRNQLLDIENRPSRESIKSKASHCTPQFELELHSNDKLIKNFKQLREQLKQSTVNCQKLRIKINEKQTQLDRLKLSERDYITLNHQLKSQIEHLKHSNEDYKSKLDILKNMAKNAGQSQQQVQFLKITVNDLKNKITHLQNQRNKIMEISILEKVELQEKIKKFQAKKSSDVQYVQDMEIQVSKLREKCIKLQNQLKKVQIKYEEEMYTKQWANGNFQIEHLHDQLKQADCENQQILTKHKKQKQKRNMLQKRVLQLEQSTGLWIVKAQTYEIQNKALQKKYRKLQKRMEQVKQQSDRRISQTLTLQQKFAKSTGIADQLISRVKRQLYGDIVALAKSCEFKINKLKQEKEGFFKNAQNQQSLKKTIYDNKTRSKSKQNLKIRTPQEKQQKDFATEAKPIFTCLKEKFDECISGSGIQLLCQRPTQRSKEGNSEISNRSLNPLSQIQNIEARIKKQRDEMERKIRQKMLYRKLQVANSPEKHQLRQDYFRLFDH